MLRRGLLPTANKKCNKNTETSKKTFKSEQGKEMKSIQIAH